MTRNRSAPTRRDNFPDRCSSGRVKFWQSIQPECSSTKLQGTEDYSLFWHYATMRNNRGNRALANILSATLLSSSCSVECVTKSLLTLNFFVIFKWVKTHRF